MPDADALAGLTLAALGGLWLLAAVIHAARPRSPHR